MDFFGFKLGHAKLDEQGDEEYQYYEITILTEFVYSYINPLIRLGARKALEISDVPPMPEYQASEVTEKALTVAWEEELKARPQPILFRALVQAFYRSFLYGVLNAAVFVTVVGMQPFLVTKLLEYIATGNATILGINSGVGIAFTLGMTSIIGAFTINNAMYLMYCFGMAIRSALIGVIFKKSLSISNSAKAKHSIGEIITLMSVDVERVWLACLLMVWLPMSPLLSTVAIVLLYMEMGYSALIVGAFVLVVIYLQEVISKMIGDTRVALVKHTVERTKLTNEALQGIRVVKMYAWEGAIEERISEVRSKEVSLLRTYLMLKISNTVLPFLSPVIMTYLLFMSYSAMGGEMSIKTIYAGLAILNIIRLPMAVFPLARTAAAEATKALTRLTSFLLLPEMEIFSADPVLQQQLRQEDSEEKNALHNPVRLVKEANGSSAQKMSECMVCIDDATFQWSDDNSSDSTPTTTAVNEAASKGYSKLSSGWKKFVGGEKTDNSDQNGIELRSENEVRTEYALQHVSLKIFRGELVAVVGSVGSGKSSLVAAILQQIHRVKGSQFLRGRVAYVSQDHWIQNKSVRDNVLFFADIDEERYMDTMDASQLSRDLVMLPSADHTEIGERGINLSGGQKARVNIARAIYASDADLFLMDDPLAAVDAHVGRAVFEDALLGQLQGKARVVVLSSNYHLLPRFDKVVVVNSGRVDVFTDYEALCVAYPQYRLVSEDSVDGILNDAVNGNGLEDDCDEDEEDVTLVDVGKIDSVYRRRQRSIEEKQEAGKTSLIGEEDRERGSVSFATFHKYYSVALQNRNGTVVFVSILVLFAIAQGFRVLCDLWIGIWGKDADRSHSHHSTSYYMILFTIFLVATCVFVAARSGYFLSTCISASSNLHKHILRSVLSAPVNTYFDVTPIGRVLNRFTKDLDSVDSLLPDFFLTALQSGAHVISVLMLCIGSTPYFIIVLFPLATVFYLIQEHFRKTSRELKRLDGVSRSPIYNHFGELLAGLPTIRAYGKQGIFLKNHHNLCDINKKCFFAFNVTNRWLSLRLDLISTLVVLSVGLIAVIVVDFGSNVDHNILGLALVYSIQLSGMLQWTVRTVIETENSMTSVERLLAFNKIDSESKQTDSISGGIDESWPSEGALEITRLSLRYREGLPLVLNGVNLKVPGGHKVGVCGRTGAGKSSLVLALLRLVEPEAGSSLLIDGIDIQHVSLFRLRSKLTVIPQDPYMFSGSLRYNLDPFDNYSDTDIWEALDRTHLKEDIIAKFPEKLNHQVSDRGDNISVGQRQLLCIARALLRKSKIIIMDEATASVDTHTDQKIQSTIRTEFSHCTVLTIAHRLDTIIDYDMVVVMDAGKVAESGSPSELLGRADSLFAGLVGELGGDAKVKFQRLLAEKQIVKTASFDAVMNDHN